MTTHSPLCLSNIPKSNIIYLQKTENGTKVDISEHKETFGANLYEILDDAFYLKYKSMGRFASKYIQKLIKEITECSSLDQENYNIYKQKIEDILEETGSLFKNEGELYRLLYGGYAEPDEFGKRPLSKFIKDIYQNTKNALDGIN